MQHKCRRCGALVPLPVSTCGIHKSTHPNNGAAGAVTVRVERRGVGKIGGKPQQSTLAGMLARVHTGLPCERRP
jgi:hypothetical protein